MTTDAVMVDSAASAPAASSNPDLRWYIVHAYSGMEKAVERNIRERIERGAARHHLLPQPASPRRVILGKPFHPKNLA